MLLISFVEIVKATVLPVALASALILILIVIVEAENVFGRHNHLSWVWILI